MFKTSQAAGSLGEYFKPDLKDLAACVSQALSVYWEIFS